MQPLIRLAVIKQLQDLVSQSFEEQQTNTSKQADANQPQQKQSQEEKITLREAGNESNTITKVSSTIGRTTTRMTYCCQCRISRQDHEDSTGGHNLTQCARCKITKYCSKECQRKHYKIHKLGCRQLDQCTKFIVNDSTSLMGKHDDQKSGKPEELRLQRANLIFQMAYRSSDTPERGAFMYDMALEEYCYYLLGVLQAEAAHRPADPANSAESRSSHWQVDIIEGLGRLAFMLAVVGRTAQSVKILGIILMIIYDNDNDGDTHDGITTTTDRFPDTGTIWDDWGSYNNEEGNPSESMHVPLSYYLTAGYLKAKAVALLLKVEDDPKTILGEWSPGREKLLEQYGYNSIDRIITDRELILHPPSVNGEKKLSLLNQQVEHLKRQFASNLATNEEYDNKGDDNYPLNNSNINQCMRAMSMWRILLSRNILLTPHVLPDLFHDSHGRAQAPHELFLLVQDSFFMDPTLDNVLDEYVEWYE